MHKSVLITKNSQTGVATFQNFQILVNLYLKNGGNFFTG